MAPKIYAYPQSDDLAAALGQYIVAAQNQAVSTAGKFNIAVSGGSLGNFMKKALIDNAQIAPQVQWDKWQVFFSDERLVPSTHADSNSGLFVSSVVDHLSGAKPTIFSIDESLLTGADGQVAGADLDKDEQIAAAYAKVVPPKFDLILLGCGPDGHTCSLFPGHKLVDERSKTVAHIWDSPKPPPRRITVTFPVLEAATYVAFVAEGEGKAPTLKKVFNDSASQLPSKLVNDNCAEVSWFVGDSALDGVDVLASKY